MHLLVTVKEKLLFFKTENSPKMQLLLKTMQTVERLQFLHSLTGLCTSFQKWGGRSLWHFSLQIFVLKC